MSGGRYAQRKGKRGELEIAQVLSKMFSVECRRGASAWLPGIVAPDIADLPEIHVEVKRRGDLSLPAAIRQAKQDTPAGKVAVVAHRPNRSPWMVTMDLADLPAVSEAVGRLMAAKAAGVGKHNVDSQGCRASRHTLDPFVGHPGSPKES